jgi:hypothetical protein
MSDNMGRQQFYKIISIALILLMVLSLTPHAATTTTGPGTCSSATGGTTTNWYTPINNQISAQWQSTLPLATIVVILSFLIAGLIFLIGSVLNSGRVRGFALGEFYEALATAIMVGAFLLICSVLFNQVPGLVSCSNPYATSFSLMTQTTNSVATMYNYIFVQLYFPYADLVSYSVSTSVGAVGSTWLKAAGEFIGFSGTLVINLYAIPVTLFFLDPLAAIASLLTDGLATIVIEYYLLVFFSIAAIPCFLIPGILFRAIFPTRALGGMLIALAIGFYLVMPALFSIAYTFTYPGLQKDMQLGTATIGKIAQLCNPSISTGGNSGNINLGVGCSSTPIADQMKGVSSSLDSFWLLIFFYPALIISVTYAVVRELANFIGRAVTSFGRLRLFL